MSAALDSLRYFRLKGGLCRQCWMLSSLGSKGGLQRRSVGLGFFGLRWPSSAFGSVGLLLELGRSHRWHVLDGCIAAGCVA